MVKKLIFSVIGIFMMLFSSLVSYRYSTAVVNKNKYPVFGIDLSHYQGDVNWKKLRQQGVEFAFIKATEGSGHVDESAADNIRNSADTDIAVSCYHFFSFDSPGETQAENFIRTVPKESIDMPPVIDIEYYADKRQHKPSLEDTEAILTPLLKLLEEYYGRKPIIYANYSVYSRYIREKYSDYPLWIRNTHEEPNFADWKFWQYSDKGMLDGYIGKEKYIDYNVYCGSREEFEKEFNLSTRRTKK
ncbi:MAG: glycosyl hydrolase family 25 [Ruminococcus sp.]|nr:glycosyl hydrolase family 25 [Ruminococcus sp.]